MYRLQRTKSSTLALVAADAWRKRLAREFRKVRRAALLRVAADLWRLYDEAKAKGTDEMNGLSRAADHCEAMARRGRAGA